MGNGQKSQHRDGSYKAWNARSHPTECIGGANLAITMIVLRKGHDHQRGFVAHQKGNMSQRAMECGNKSKAVQKLHTAPALAIYNMKLNFKSAKLPVDLTTKQWDEIKLKRTLGLNYAELTKHVGYSIKNCV